MQLVAAKRLGNGTITQWQKLACFFIEATCQDQVVAAQPLNRPLDGGQLFAIGTDRLQEYSRYFLRLFQGQSAAACITSAFAWLAH